MNQPVILVIEDDPAVRRGIVDVLEYAGYQTLEAADGHAGMETALTANYRLLLLDLVMPGPSGFDILSALKKKRPGQAVIILSARGEENDRVRGLVNGADDYVVKPFSMKELLARVEALGRRGGAVENQTVLQSGEICLDVAKRRVTRKGERVDLSPRELEVLQIFLQEPGRTFSRDEICERIWEREHEYDTRTVEIFIMRLRKKLGANVITTVRGVGYVMEVTE